jgi:hypothetical protein
MDYSSIGSNQKFSPLNFTTIQPRDEKVHRGVLLLSHKKMGNEDYMEICAETRKLQVP